eukprot:TRINITY_DN6307_c0_g1_i1.p1 TRINITY_DN6307_c0_g1~~TRINITY_DN6307_c0_g1_i1.p1  ORF type:complete len:1068 (+),score=320.30 TRINITY_DN6307_c0_g1_i1:58-3261(+)
MDKKESEWTHAYTHGGQSAPSTSPLAGSFGGGNPLFTSASHASVINSVAPSASSSQRIQHHRSYSSNSIGASISSTAQNNPTSSTQPLAPSSSALSISANASSSSHSVSGTRKTRVLQEQALLTKAKKNNVLSNLIWKAVYDATMPVAGTNGLPNVPSSSVGDAPLLPNSNASVESNHTVMLKKYLQNAKHREIVYKKMIERTERMNTEKVLERVVDLLRTYLPKYLPTTAVLLDLDHFCNVHVNSFPGNKELAKAFAYIKGMVTTKLTGGSKDSHQRNITSAESNASASISPSASRESVRLDSISERNPKSKKKRKTDKLISEAPNFIKNITLSKPPPKKMPKKPAYATCLIETPTFGGQFKRSPEGPVSDELFYWKEETGVREFINILKKKDEVNFFLCGLKRPVLQLFNYKYYKEQSPLALTKHQLDTLIANIIQPPQVGNNDRLKASKVLMKLILNIFCIDVKTGAQVLISSLFEMLSFSMIETKVHAFNFLFNLSVNINYFEEVQEALESKPSTLNIAVAQKHMFEALNEMILWLIHADENNEKVWLIALDTLLYFIIRNGKLDKSKLLELDPRFLTTFLKVLENLDDQTHRLLIRLLVNVLYPSSKLTLNVDLVKAYGVDFIIDQYKKVRSWEARENLFAILFDYIAHDLTYTKKIEEGSGDALAILAECLRWFDMPQFLFQIFKLVPDKFVEKIVGFMQKHFDGLSGKVDKQLIVTILYEGFEKLALQHNKLEQEFELRLWKMLKDGEIGDNIDTLNALLTSDIASNRKNGELWLLQLLRPSHVGQALPSAKLKDAVDSCFHGLADSPDAKVRLVYLQVVEKLMLVVRGTMQTFGEEQKVASMFHLMNEHVTRIIKVPEQNQTNLMFVFDMIFNMISIRKVVNSEIVAEDYERNDTLNAAFLSGEVDVSLDLLKLVNTPILVHIFLKLVDTAETNRAKVILLYLIAQNCKMKPAELEQIGGVNFFRGVLASRDPQLTYLSGQFIAAKLEEDDPPQYRAVLSRIFTKAQEEDDENLVSNHFLQIKSIINTMLPERAFIGGTMRGVKRSSLPPLPAVPRDDT